MNKGIKYTVKSKSFCIAILIVLPVLGNAQEMINDMEKILIRNLIVIDQSGKTEDVAVSILIKKKKLELMTQDKISVSQADISFDANGGVSSERLK